MLMAFAAVLWYIYVYAADLLFFSKNFSKIKVHTFTTHQPRVFVTVQAPLPVQHCLQRLFLLSFLLDVFLHILHILIITINMPEETRYITVSGNVPNGGVPPGRTFVSVAGLPYGPNPHHYPFSPAPFSAAYGPPPPYYGPQHNGKFSQCVCSLRMLSFELGNDRGYQPYYPTLHPGPGPPAPPASQTATPPPPPPVLGPVPHAEWEAPGAYLDGQIIVVNGGALLHAGEYTTFSFLKDGERPCDAPDGYYPYNFSPEKVMILSTATLQEFMVALGVPEDRQCGITEMDELGDNRWTAGVTIIQGTDDARKTLAEIGWTKRRSDIAPIWIVVKR